MPIRSREHRHGRSYKGLHIDCDLPEDEWALLMDELKEMVRDPVNVAVLEDPKHSHFWETWFDGYIDSGICERYFVTGMGKKWDFGVDREAVRTFMRLLVILVASREKTSNRRPKYVDLQKERIANVTKVRGWKANKRKDKIVLPNNPTSPCHYPVEKLQNTEFVLQIRIFSSNKIKFLYVNETAPLQLFLGQVHNKFALGQDHGIESFEAQIGSNVYVIDSPDERDWQQIIRIIKGLSMSVPAEIVVKVMKL